MQNILLLQFHNPWIITCRYKFLLIDLAKHIMQVFPAFFKGRPSCAGAGSSSSAAQGEGYSSMDMSTSGTLAAEAPPRGDPHSTTEDNITSREIEEDKDNIKKEIEISNENIPAVTATVVSSGLVKSRLDDESGGTTTSSEIEVISNCTSMYDDTVPHQNM